MRFTTQLRPRRFHSATQVWRLSGGNEDNDLWALNHVIPTGIDDEMSRAVTSVFVPTNEQRQAIMDGENIALTILGGQPPVMVRLTDEPLGKP